jgi:hypothetical protein
MSKFQIKLGRKPRPFRSKMAQELLSLALLYVVLDSNFFKRKNLVLHTKKCDFATRHQKTCLSQHTKILS